MCSLLIIKKKKKKEKIVGAISIFFNFSGGGLRCIDTYIYAVSVRVFIDNPAAQTFVDLFCLTFDHWRGRN